MNPRNRCSDVSAALRQALYLEARAHELRRALRDHQRDEFIRIHEAEKRARGLRLFAAWSRPSPRAPLALPGTHPAWRPAPWES